MRLANSKQMAVIAEYSPLLLQQGLVLGSTPQDMTFDIAKMRPHLVACLRAGAMTQFPSF